MKIDLLVVNWAEQSHTITVRFENENETTAYEKKVELEPDQKVRYPTGLRGRNYEIIVTTDDGGEFDKGFTASQCRHHTISVRIEEGAYVNIHPQDTCVP